MPFRLIQRLKEKLKGKNLKGMICLRAGRWQHTSTRLQYRWLTTEGKWKCFLFWLLGDLLSTQEARVALGYRLVKLLRLFSAKQLINPLPRVSMTRWLHATRLPFLNYLAPFICLQGPLLTKKRKKKRIGLVSISGLFSLPSYTPIL